MADSTGAIVGGTANLLGGLLTLKSQKDLLNEKLRQRNAAEMAARQGAADVSRGVLGAAASQGGALGLQQGLRSADRLQRSALRDVNVAKQQDLARQDRFDAEQRQRKEKLGAGIGQALGGFGTALATSGVFDSSPEAAPSGTASQQAGSSDGSLARLTGLGSDRVAPGMASGGGGDIQATRQALAAAQQATPEQAQPQAATPTVVNPQGEVATTGAQLTPAEMAAEEVRAAGAQAPTVRLPSPGETETSDLRALTGTAIRPGTLKDPFSARGNLSAMGIPESEAIGLLNYADTNPDRAQFINDMIASGNAAGIKNLVGSLRANGMLDV